MEYFWRSGCLSAAFTMWSCVYMLSFSSCWCLNDEGVALLRFKDQVLSDPQGALCNWNDELENPCSWFGVSCSGGCVVDLNLKDLCLRGTLAQEIGNLVHIKSIILRNNSFSGVIPQEIANLKELEVLDIGYNNFTGKLPCHLDNNISIRILNSGVKEGATQRRLLQETPIDQRKYWTYNFTLPPPRGTPRNEPPPSDTSFFMFSPPPPSEPPPPPPEEISPPPEEIPPPTAVDSPPFPVDSSPSPDAQISPPLIDSPVDGSNAPVQKSKNDNRRLIIYSLAIGGPLLVLFLIFGLCFCYYSKMATVKPWVTGISGQLQRAFVTGVPKLKRSELVAACEDFSNVIGSSSLCTLYKGTLSSGVEIAVASVAAASSKEWSRSLESQFRKKIDTLSKVNHKNFVCLLGYCEEDAPFTRMMVFEYAPNGTLFEHIHIREAEHLDWSTRLRIAMGVAYCLEHMHQLSPAIPHKNLTSSSIYLTEDYAGKISDFIYYDERVSSEIESSIETNIYSFGVVLFEMITGRLPYSVGGESIVNWASDYLRVQPIREMVDPTLRTYREDQLQLIGELIKLCSCSDPRKRPSMREVCVSLREITGIGPEGAIPKCSPLWWAELEIISTEGG